MLERERFTVQASRAVASKLTKLGYGAPRFHMAARKAGLKAIVGAELTIRTAQQAHSPLPPTLWRLPVLVASRDGYRNLSRLLTRMKAGVPQASGEVRPEPVFDVEHFGSAIRYMASLPLDTNVLFMNIKATKMPFEGRG